jgi:hypothetical protein
LETVTATRIGAISISPGATVDSGRAGATAVMVEPSMNRILGDRTPPKRTSVALVKPRPRRVTVVAWNGGPWSGVMEAISTGPTMRKR